MATAPAATSKATAYQQFIAALKKLTGLNSATLVVWTLAEKGPAGNPLNIMPGGKLANYGTPQAAAQATAQLLKSNPAYHPILNAAGQGDKAQLDAIIASPWDKCRYRGTTNAGTCANAKPGTLIYALYAAVFGGPPLPGKTGAVAADPITITGGAKIDVGPIHTSTGGIANAVAGPHTDAQGNTVGGFDLSGVENWLANEALVALLYVTFTVLAVGLVLMAFGKATGQSLNPASAVAGIAARGAAKGEIPF